MLIHEYLATGSYDYTAKVTDLATGEILCTITHNHWVHCITFSPDGNLIATGSQDNTAKITEIATGITIRTINHEWLITSIAFSPDGKLFASGSYDKTTRITDIATGEIFLNHKYSRDIKTIAFSPDGTLFTIGCDCTVAIVEIATKKRICAIQKNTCIIVVKFTPDGKWLLVNDRYVPLQEHYPIESTFIELLTQQNPRLSFNQLSKNIQRLLFTLPEDLRNQLVTDVPQQKDAAQPMDFDQIDDNPIPLKDRCPSGEHNTKESCCGCTSENDEHTHKKIKR